MKRKKTIPAQRHGIEVRYAYEGKNAHKIITVSSVEADRKDRVLSRTTFTELHPNAKKKALDAAKALAVVGGRCEVLILDENLMREEYLTIHDTPVLVRESK